MPPITPASLTSPPSPAALVGGTWAPLSAATLGAAKWLALLLMVVDHVNTYLLGASQPWMGALGRISMPLFALVLGCNLARPGLLESGGHWRMSRRLALGAALATPPVLALNPLLGGWWPLNMMVTLLVAVVGIGLLHRGDRQSVLLGCGVMVWGGALGEYAWPAVGLCAAAWAYQRQPGLRPACAFLVCLALLHPANGNSWALAAVPVLLALRQWTTQLPRAQWAFYAFYPAHLWLLWAWHAGATATL
jgi:TraX protein